MADGVTGVGDGVTGVGDGVTGVADGVTGVADGVIGVGVSVGCTALQARVHFEVLDENALHVPLNALTLNEYDLPHSSPVASVEASKLPDESVPAQEAKVHPPEPRRL